VAATGRGPPADNIYTQTHSLVHHLRDTHLTFTTTCSIFSIHDIIFATWHIITFYVNEGLTLHFTAVTSSSTSSHPHKERLPHFRPRSRPAALPRDMDPLRDARQRVEVKIREFFSAASRTPGSGEQVVPANRQQQKIANNAQCAEQCRICSCPEPSKLLPRTACLRGIGGASGEHGANLG
jgi:hypothetical protein